MGANENTGSLEWAEGFSQVNEEGGQHTQLNALQEMLIQESKPDATMQVDCPKNDLQLIDTQKDNLIVSKDLSDVQ